MIKPDLKVAYYQIKHDGGLLARRYASRAEADEIVSASSTDATVLAFNQYGKVIERGWFWPSSARKAHFDRGDGRAICGRWSRYGIAGEAVLQGDEKSRPSRNDCLVCRRGLEAGK